MKTAKKMVIYGICALLIATTSILGTLAYLTDSEEVTNTFTMGKVSIILNEAKVDEAGKPEGNTRVTSNAYKMIPGMTYVKDPTMTVENGSAEAYVRMLVKINCYKELQDIFNNQFLPQNFVKGWDDTVWVSTRVVDVDTTANVATYEFRYKEAVKADTADVKLEPLFTEFTVPGEFDGDDLAKLNGFEIKVIGHAIQTGSFVDNAGNADVDAAWAAFDAQIASSNP